jgi:hypothetical protein
LQAFTAAGYLFSSWSCSGPNCYPGGSQSAAITITGPVLELANFQQTPSGYSVTFQENGLPPGVVWSILVGGTYYITSGSSLTVTGLSGTVDYAYQGIVFGNYFYDRYYYLNCYLYQNYCFNDYGWYEQYFIYDQYYNNPYYLNEYICTYACAGSVSGSTTSTSGYTFFRTIYQQSASTTYTATFQESGLPPGSTWSVTVGGNYFSSSSNSLTVYGINGAVNYYYQTSAANCNYQSSCSGTISGQSTVTATYQYTGGAYTTYTTYTTSVPEYPEYAAPILLLLALATCALSLRRTRRS